MCVTFFYYDREFRKKRINSDRNKQKGTLGDLLISIYLLGKGGLGRTSRVPGVVE